MRTRWWVGIVLLALVIPLSAAQAGSPDRVDSLAPDGLSWQTGLEYVSATLTVLGPDGEVFTQEYAAGEPLYWSAADKGLADGDYTYELRFASSAEASAASLEEGRAGVGVKQKLEAEPDGTTVYGSFAVLKGALVFSGENGAVLMDNYVADDQIVTGSLCVGFDCVNGESFGYDTLRLKENNLRIKFNDTSTGSFPTNDWQIVANDSINGGASYLAIQDDNTGRIPFRVMAGADADALYVGTNGRVGLGTASPVLELHIKDSDTPSVRLEQDGSGGWTPQTWDVAGNESNFFVRDATNGSKLPFRIQPNTPSNTLTLKSSGNVGIGTWIPGYQLQVTSTGKHAEIMAQRTDGAEALIRASDVDVQFGSQSNHPILFIVNGEGVALLDTNGNLKLTGRLTQNASLTAASDEIRADDTAEVESLSAQIAAQEERIAQLEQQNQDLETRLAALEVLLSGLKTNTK